MKIICKKDNYTLVRPFNSWDMSYHLFDKDGNDHLIDIGDIYDTMEDLEKYGGILWEDFSNLYDIDEILMRSWKKL